MREARPKPSAGSANNSSPMRSKARTTPMRASPSRLPDNVFEKLRALSTPRTPERDGLALVGDGAMQMNRLLILHIGYGLPLAISAQTTIHWSILRATEVDRLPFLSIGRWRNNGAWPCSATFSSL